MLDLVKICNRVVEYSFYVLFFLVPLILTPWNYELFEFNKMILVYLLTIIIVAFWLVKMIALKKFSFKRSFWDIPLIIFFLSQFISFVLSIDHHTSAWGYYSRFNGGLISAINYLLLYWAFVSNMNKKNTLNSLKILLASGALVSVYGILEHFGIDAKYWVQDVRNRVFSTLGQPNWLAAWLIALIPLAWGLTLAKIGNRYFLYLLQILFYLCLLYTNSRSAIIAFGMILVLFWALQLIKYRWKNIKNNLVLSLAIVIFISLLVGTPWTTKIFNFQFSIFNPENQAANQSQAVDQPLLISESGDIRKVVWRGAIEIWKHYPFFGTGPETFAYSYYWYRPREHNDLSEWDFLYNKAHNEYLNYLATTGLAGLAGYLTLIGSFIIWVLKISKSEFLISKQFPNSKFQKELGQLDIRIIRISLLSGFVGILITNFFGFSVVPVSVLFFLFPAMSVSLNKDIPEEEKRPKLSESQYGLILPVLIFSAYLFASILRYWYADAQFSSGNKFDKAGQYDLAFNALQKAVSLKPNEPVYHDELSLVSSDLASLTIKQNNATLSAELQKLAISESNKAIDASPYNINFWKNRTKVFYRLAEIDTRFYQMALESLLKASELAPTEPKIKYNLGLIYATLGQNQQSIKTLEEVVTLKPNYEDGRYALALFYEQDKQKDKARQQLEYILKNINPASEKAKEKLKTM